MPAGDVCVLGEHVQQLVVITESGTATGPKVRIDSCPRCRRPLHLAHASFIDEMGEVVDLGAVAYAQSLHYANCRG